MYYYQGLQHLQSNDILQALQSFEKHEPFYGAVKPIVQFALKQSPNTQEYIARWLLQRALTPQLKVDVLNILSCALKKTLTQDSLPFLIEAEQLTRQFKIKRGPTLINLTHSYSLLGCHEKALQYAIESISETSGRQRVVALHNTAVEYSQLRNQQLASQFHQEAYDHSMEIFGPDDPLTLKMAKNLTPKKQSPQKAKPNARRFRSVSRQSDQPEPQKTFYHRRKKSVTQLNQTFSNTFNTKMENNFMDHCKTVNIPKPTEASESEDEMLPSSISLTQSKFMQLFHKDENKQNRIKFLEGVLNQYLAAQDEPAEIHIVDQAQQFQFDILMPQRILKQDNRTSQHSVPEQLDQTFAGNHTRDETFDTTYEPTLQFKAAQRIQKWYRLKARQRGGRSGAATTSQKPNYLDSAIKIQSQYRKYRAQTRKEQCLAQKKFYHRVVKLIVRYNHPQPMQGVITLYLNNQTLQITAVFKRINKCSLNLPIQHVRSKYFNFDEFCQLHPMKDPKFKLLALELQKNFRLKSIVNLLYLHNDALQLYGVTDTREESMSNSLCQTQRCNRIAETPVYDLEIIQHIQAFVRSRIAQDKFKAFLNQKKKSSRIVEKFQGSYYYLILKSPVDIAAYDLGQRTMCKNVLHIPPIVQQFYGQLRQENCQEIIQIENHFLSFTEDAQFIIEREKLKQRKVNPATIVSAIVKLQRAFRSKCFRHDVGVKILQRKLERDRQNLFELRRSFLIDSHCGILIAQAQFESNQQILKICGIVKGHSYSKPYVMQSKQRLFFPLPQTELLQIGKILLSDATIHLEDDTIQIRCQSIEQIQGSLNTRSLQYQSIQDPTLPGRNYFSRNILSRQYLLHKLPEFHPPQLHSEAYDPKIYQIRYMQNTYQYLKANIYKRIRDQKIVSDINEYVNAFQGQQVKVERIVDPVFEELKRQKSAAMKIMKAVKYMKFKIALQKKIEQARLRRPKPKPVVVKEYYYDIIRKSTPFSTQEVLTQNGYSFLVLAIKEVEDVKFEWLLISRFYDIVVTEYCVPRRFYQLKHCEFQNFYTDTILKGSPLEIVKYFSRPIEQFHPSQQADFIHELKEQFSRKVIKKIKMLLFRKLIREIPCFSSQLIRQFVNDQYVRINYFYLKASQTIRVSLIKDRKTRIFEFEFFYLDALFAKFHQSTQTLIAREHFIKIITLQESKNFKLYSYLLLPIITLLHSYCYVNSELELTFQPYEIPLVEIFKEKTIKKETEERYSTHLMDLKLIIHVQKKWKTFIQKAKFEKVKLFYQRLKLKLLAKKGQLYQRTYLKLSNISELQTEEYGLVLMYIFQKDLQIKCRIELRNKALKMKLFNIFQFDKSNLVTSGNIKQNLLRHLRIVNNQLQLIQQYDDVVSPLEQQPLLKLFTKKPSAPQIVFHQRRLYEDGKEFHYNAIHTGAQPVPVPAETNLVKIDVDLKQFKSQYPQIDFSREDILPKISEQLVSSIKLGPKHLQTKPMLKSSLLKVSGSSKIRESEKQVCKESEGSNVKTLMKFQQFYRKKRINVTIQLEEVPVSSFRQMQKDLTTALYETNLNVKGLFLQSGRSLLWQMTATEAEAVTGQKDHFKQAEYIKDHISVLESSFLLVARFKKLEIPNVMIIPLETLKKIQRLARNRKFLNYRRLYEQELSSLKQGGGRAGRNIVYFNILQLGSLEHFIVIVVERKQYLLIAWNLRDYQRYSLTIFNKKVKLEQMVACVHFIGNELRIVA